MFYIQIPHISKFRLYEAKALGNYRSESPIRISLKNHQQVKLLDYTEKWSWAVDNSGSSGWAPTSFLRVSQVKLQDNSIFRLNLSLVCTLGNESHTISYEPLENGIELIFWSYCIAKFENGSWGDKLLLILENDCTVLSRYEINLWDLKNQTNDGIFMTIIEFKLHRNFIASCEILVKLSEDMERLRSHSLELINESIAEVKNEPKFYYNEEILFQSEIVAMINTLRLEGTFFLTNFRLFFNSDSKHSHFFCVPILCIDQIELLLNSIKVSTKDLRTIEYFFNSNEEVKKFVEKYSPDYGLNFCARYNQSVYDPELMWDIYDLNKEFTRLGAIGTSNFRISGINTSYYFCPSYPNLLIQPLSIDNNSLFAIGEFRANTRIPSLCWYREGVSLYRASQSTLEGKKSLEDEDFMRKACITYIIEAKYKANTKVIAQDYDSPNYSVCKVYTMNFPDTQRLKASFEQMKSLYERKDYFFTVLHHSKWLHYLKNLIMTSKSIADYIHYEKASVMITCSDGWDSSASISSIVQILLDPFYRTFEGFQILISKEWTSFGHKFKERLHGQERGPYFIQFLDTVHQILLQFPNEFEFTCKYLLFLADSLHSGLYGTFMGNCDKDYEILKISTLSLWREKNEEFVTKNFIISETPILQVKNSIPLLKLWEYFSRWQVF